MKLTRCTICSATSVTYGMALTTTWSSIPSFSRPIFSASAALLGAANTFDGVTVYLHRKPLRLSLPDLLHKKLSMGACHVGERGFFASPASFTGGFTPPCGSGLPAHQERARRHPRRRAGNVPSNRVIDFFGDAGSRLFDDNPEGSGCFQRIYGDGGRAVAQT